MKPTTRILEENKDLLKDYYGDDFNMLDYALYLSIPLQDLCILYFDAEEECKVRNRIIQAIKSHCKYKNERLPISFRNKLLHSFSKSSGRKIITYGTALKNLVEYFKNEEVLYFFKMQITSPLSLDRKRAHNVAEFVNDDDATNLLWNSWKDFSCPNSLHLWMKKSTDKALSEHIEIIYKTGNYHGFSFLEIIKRTAKQDPAKLNFLKNGPALYYLRACIATNLDPGDEYLTEMISETDNLDMSYLIWCLNRHG